MAKIKIYLYIALFLGVCFVWRAVFAEIALDTTPPKITRSLPSGTLIAGSYGVRIFAETDEPSECRYSEDVGLAFEKLPFIFATSSGGMMHESVVQNLTDYYSYAYAIKCRDNFNNTTEDDYFISFSLGSTLNGDFTFPSKPFLVVAQYGYEHIALQWSKSYDNDEVFNYRVYRCSGGYCAPHEIIASPTTTVYADYNVLPNQVYGYIVSAIDKSANESPRSRLVRATTTMKMEEINLTPIPELDVDKFTSESENVQVQSIKKDYFFNRNLKIGDQGEDVLELQRFLNNQGISVAVTGAGSKGNETRFFGALTKHALSRFQEMHKQKILAPLQLVYGTGYFGEATRSVANELNNKEISPSNDQEKRALPVRKELTSEEKLKILTAQVKALQSAIDRFIKSQ